MDPIKFSNSEAHPVLAVLDLVQELNERQIAPQEALRTSKELEHRLGLSKLELVWDKEHVNDQTQFHALLVEQERTFSLGVSSRNRLPWALRGATAVSPNALVTVNDYTVTVDQAIQFLDFFWSDAELLRQIIDYALLAKASQGIAGCVDEARVEEALRLFFSQNGLDRAEVRRAWLLERGLGIDQVRSAVQQILISRELEQSVLDGKEDEDSCTDPKEYWLLRLAQFEIAPEQFPEAEAILQRRQPASLWDTWNELLVTVDVPSMVAPIRFFEVCRKDFGADLSLLDSLNLNEAGLFRMRDGTFRMIACLSREETASPADIRQRTVESALRDRLAIRRAKAKIEWHWGRE